MEFLKYCLEVGLWVIVVIFFNKVFLWGLRRGLRYWRAKSVGPLRWPQGVRVIPKPWGHEEIWARTEKYVGKILVIKAEESLSKQYHKQKDETILVLEGELSLDLERGKEKKSFILLPGEVYHVTPGMIHRMSALKAEVKLVEVSTPEVEDVVRLEDKYGRVE